MEKLGVFLSRILAAVLLLAALGAAGLAIFACRNYHNAMPILVREPEQALSQLEGMLEELCAGSYGDASRRMLGCPELGLEEPPEDELGRLLWDAFSGSMEYRLEGGCYTTEAGLAQDISLTYLDLSTVTARLRERSQTLLEQRVAQAEDVSQIYDENNEYREDFVMEVLLTAAADALREDGQTVTVQLTVNLKHQDGQWWVVADKALLDAISGGIAF